MTELEKMQRARMYVQKLAEGIDPLTDRELPEDTALNQVRLSRCFFYVAEVLGRVIDNGGEVVRTRQARRKDFQITPEQLREVTVSPEPIGISQFCKLIGAAAGGENGRGPSAVAVTEWLVRKGFLCVETVGGKKRKRATAQAAQIGIFEESRIGTYGEYVAVLYDSKAQQFVLDNLPAILAEDQAGDT